MSQTLKHLKNCTIADGPDPNQVNPSDWNAAHVFSGDALGGLLMRDTGDATYGASWLSSVAVGRVLISNGVGAAPTWAASLALGGNLTVNGLLQVAGFGQQNLVAGGVGDNALVVRNTTAGTANTASVYIGNDASSSLLILQSLASNYTPNNFYQPNGSLVWQTGAGGLSVIASAAAGMIRFYTGASGAERMRVDASGLLLVNMTTSLGAIINVTSDGGSLGGLALKNSNAGNSINYVLFYNSANGVAGNIAQSGATSVIYGTTSDARLKTDHGPAVDLAALRAVAIHDFEWTADGAADRGVFAQELVELYPRAVLVGTDERTDEGALVRPWMVDLAKLVPDLVVGFQDHDARIAALEARA